MGPEMMQKFRDQAERFGARLLTEQADRVELASEPGGVHSVWVGDTEHRARTVDPGDGRGAQEAVRPRRGGARRARRELLRDLRRGILPRRTRRSSWAAGTRPWRRRSSSRSSPPRSRSCTAAPTSGRPRSCSSAPARRRTSSCSPPTRWSEFVAGENGALGHALLKNAETGEEREIPVSGAFIAIGHEPQSRARARTDRPRRGRLRRDRGALHAHQPARACSQRATSSTTPTARRSPPPAPAARRRSTPSGICATRPRSRRPRACPMGDLAEAQWAAPSAGSSRRRDRLRARPRARAAALALSPPP